MHLSQEGSCQLNQVERIHHLEQALDQCQVYINELKLQLINQEFLQDQLAATEEISHIQQQAITALRTQLVEQQTLATQLTQAAQQKAKLPELADQHQLPQARQAESERFRALFHQEQIEARAFQHHSEREVARLQKQAQALESQNIAARNLADSSIIQFDAAQKKVEVLQNHLCDRQATIVDLETQLQRTKAALKVQKEILNALQQLQAPESEKNQVIQGLSKNLLKAQTKIEALETEFSSQLVLQAKLQHTCRELEQERDRDQDRMYQLEQQVAEMQEQILKQAQQATEYEAAVQHWKDQCLSAENSVLQLKAVLEQILKERNFSELTSPSNTDTSSGVKEAELPAHSSDESEPSKFLKGLKLDLPSFLNLRRPKS